MMRDFADVLNDGFNDHARAHKTYGVRPVVTTSAVLSIRRRKRIRAAGAGGTAVVAAGALAVAAMTMPGFWDQTPGQVAPWLPDAPIIEPLAERPEWCDMDYPPVNLEALGEASFAGRVYADIDTLEFVAVAADGESTVLEPSADGTVRTVIEGEVFEIHYPYYQELGLGKMMWDVSLGSGISGGDYDRDGRGLNLGYEWTTVMPSLVPEGMNVHRLSEVHQASLGFGGRSFSPRFVGDDSVVESVALWADGTQEVKPIGDGGFGLVPDRHDGLASISTRVTSPSGEVFAITSFYDASRTYANACGPFPTDS